MLPLCTSRYYRDRERHKKMSMCQNSLRSHFIVATLTLALDEKLHWSEWDSGHPLALSIQWVCCNGYIAGTGLHIAISIVATLTLALDEKLHWSEWDAGQPLALSVCQVVERLEKLSIFHVVHRSCQQVSGVDQKCRWWKVMSSSLATSVDRQQINL